MNPKVCPTCQALVPPHAPGGFCPVCLLRDAEEPPANGHSAPSLEEIAAAFPHLEIVRLIGQGGMGSVYQVRQPDLDRVVALKILAPELGRDPAFAERFAREARALCKLNHPNIVTVFEHGESGGFFYLLMEYVDGVNLRQAMRAGRFSPQQALAIVPGICDALQAAHAQGIWHRDIKPENILLDARGEVKIADFGIARMVGDPQRNFTLTMTGGALGSAAYMAPEQHETPRDVDHRADIYSLGVVIYEMLTGELPLGRFPAPSQRAAVDARIDEIVFKTLEKERELRQQSASEVKTDFNSPSKATGPRAKDPTSKAISQEFPTFPWSAGLWIGGIAAMIAGFYTSPLLMGLGLIAAPLGLIGCGWILWKIRHGTHPKENRIPLLIVAFWPVACGLAWLGAMMGGSFLTRLPTTNLTEALSGYYVLGFLVPFVVSFLLWKFLGADLSQPRSSPGFTDRVRVMCAVGLLAGGMFLFKSVKQNDTAYESHEVGTIQIHSEIFKPEEPDLAMIREAVANAVGKNEIDSRFHVYGSDEDIAPWGFRRVGTPYVVVEWTSRDREISNTRWRMIGDRLRATLPKRIGVNVQNISSYWNQVSDEVQNEYRRAREINLLLIILAPIVAVLLTVTCASSLAWVLSILALAIAAATDHSPWPAPPAGLPPSIDGWAPLEPLPMPEYDFSTTRGAMESMIKAAKKGDVEAFKRGISSNQLEMTVAEASDFSDPMRDVAKLTYASQISQEGNVASVNMVNQTTKVKTVMPLVRQDGDWKLALPDSHDSHKVEPSSSAPSTIEKRFELMEKHMNSIKSTPLQYRAACRIEVHLKRGDTLALLNEALGKFCVVVAVAGAKDQFDLVVTDPDPAQTSRLANYIGQHAEELLKEREIQGTVKIIKPAERPEKPWRAEEAASVKDAKDWNIDQASLAKSREVDEEKDWSPWAEYIKDGDMRLARGDLAGALPSYQAAWAYIAKRQLGRPGTWLEEQAMCLTRIGDVLIAQGDLPKALETYRSAQAISMGLLEKTPDDSSVRDELARIHVKVGDVQMAARDPSGATRSYRDAVAVVEKLEKNWETEYPNGSRGDDLARNYQADKVLHLIDKPDPDSWDLMWMIGQAGANKDVRLQPLLERKELRQDATLALVLAGYDYSVNSNRSGLDFILAELSKRSVGADVNEVCVLSFVDEWDRTTKAVDSHFLATDGAGGDCMNSFWGRRMLLFPRRYLEFRGKAGDGAPVPSALKAVELKPPGVDATEVGNAMSAIIKAARERNARVFQNGISRSLKAAQKQEGQDLDDFGDFGQSNFVSANKMDATNAEVVVEANDGSRRRFTFRMILEEGEWKLNELGSKTATE